MRHAERLRQPGSSFLPACDDAGAAAPDPLFQTRGHELTANAADQCRCFCSRQNLKELHNQTSFNSGAHPNWIIKEPLFMLLMVGIHRAWAQRVGASDLSANI